MECRKLDIENINNRKITNRNITDIRQIKLDKQKCE